MDFNIDKMRHVVESSQNEHLAPILAEWECQLEKERRASRQQTINTILGAIAAVGSIIAAITGILSLLL